MIKHLLQIVSLVALIAAILPSCLYLGGRMELDQVKTAMLAATVVWFIATPLWMGHPRTG